MTSALKECAGGLEKGALIAFIFHRPHAQSNVPLQSDQALDHARAILEFIRTEVA